MAITGLSRLVLLLSSIVSVTNTVQKWALHSSKLQNACQEFSEIQVIFSPFSQDSRVKDLKALYPLAKQPCYQSNVVSDGLIQRWQKHMHCLRHGAMSRHHAVTVHHRSWERSTYARISDGGHRTPWRSSLRWKFEFSKALVIPIISYLYLYLRKQHYSWSPVLIYAATYTILAFFPPPFHWFLISRPTLGNTNRSHNNRILGTIIVRRYLGNLLDNIVSFSNLSW